MKKTKVLVTGSNGMAGSSLKRLSVNYPQYDYYFATRNDADLTSEHQVRTLFLDHKPDIVISCAARVGGIQANLDMPEEFFYDNLLMNAYIIRTAIQYKVKKLFMFSSVCVFANNLNLLEESKIHCGEAFDDNFAYAYAKRNIDVQIMAAERQYGIKNYVSLIPGNIFGPEDQYDLNHAHIIPALIHKLYLAKQNNTTFNVWGDGSSLREFLYIDDLSNIIYKLLEIKQLPNKIIISGRTETSIKDIVYMLCSIANFDLNMVVWDKTKPSGQKRRPSSKKIIDQLCPNFQYTNLYEGLEISYNWFIKNYHKARLQYI